MTRNHGSESAGRRALPDRGRPFEELRTAMEALRARDVDWRRGRTAVYVFHAGEDVLRVAREAYALFQSENALGPAAFPSLRRMEREVVDMGLELLHAPDAAAGDLTSGGTESIFLAVKACRARAAARGMDTAGAEIVVPRSAHPAFDKAASVLGLRVVRVPVAPDLRADVEAMAAALTDRTILLVGSAPCFPYGVIDPIEELSELAVARDLWLHVDACVGGYFAPFARMNGVPVPPFDFELPGVASISADLHKYGYAAKGASTLFHRSEEQRQLQVFHFDDWPAGSMTTPTAAGTRPGGAVAAAWAVLNYLGVEGYREKAGQVIRARERIEAGLAELGFRVHGRPLLGLLAYGEGPADAFAVWSRLHRRGWFTGLVTEPRGIHLMLSPVHEEVAEQYLADLGEAVAEVQRGEGPSGETRARYA